MDPRIEAIAANTTSGAAELLVELLPVLDECVAQGPDVTLRAARTICLAHPAMAPLWNACAAAVAEVTRPGRFARVRQEMARAPEALAREATRALVTALGDDERPLVLTLSFSSSVARVLRRLATTRLLHVVCAESRPGGEGARLAETLRSSGVMVEMVEDALLTTYLPEAAAVVCGADAISVRDWTNKAGSFGLSAAAFFAGVPVFVVATRDKAQAALLRARTLLPRIFERTPSQLVTQFLTESGPIGPGDLEQVTERFAADLEVLLAQLPDASR